MDTFVQVPVLDTNVPPFLFNKRMAQFISKFIDWSMAEYLTAINHYRSINQERQARLVERHFNDRIIAASRPEFKNICSLMTADVWNSLSREQRRFLNEAYRITDSRKGKRQR